MIKRLIKILLFLLSAVIPLCAQMTVVITDFKNHTDSFFLDTWEQTVPEYLKSELSRSDKIVVLERRHLETVLQEKALAMTGLMDSSTVQEVGSLLGAEYVISGTISESGSDVRIDCKIIRVSTGQVKTERVQAPDAGYQGEMMSLLGNNVMYTLAGEGTYRSRDVIKKYPTTYFLAATAGLAIGTAVIGKAYNDQLDAYQQATRLSEFDERYDTANNLNITKIVFATLTGAALLGTIYCWVGNMNPDEIKAGEKNNGLTVMPLFFIDTQGAMYATVQFRF